MHATFTSSVFTCPAHTLPYTSAVQFVGGQDNDAGTVHFRLSTGCVSTTALTTEALATQPPGSNPPWQLPVKIPNWAANTLLMVQPLVHVTIHGRIDAGNPHGRGANDGSEGRMESIMVSVSNNCIREKES